MTIDEIRARWAGITKGEWVNRFNGLWVRVNGRMMPLPWRSLTPDWITAEQANIDREAIAHAPVDIDYLLKENERLRDALVGADWIIKKLAPHEAMAIMVRGYKPSDEDIATGTKYRKLIDDALAPQPDDAILTQSGRNSDAIAAEKE